MYWISGISGALLLLVIFFVLRSQPNNVFSANKSTEKTIVIEPKTLKNEVTLSGNVAAEKQTTLRFQTAGKLTWVGVKEGDTVKAGQVIATLDQRELQKRLERSLKDYMSSRWSFEQTKDDHKGDYTGTWNLYTTDKITRIVQDSQFGLDKSVIDVELAALNKELSVLVSPIEGIITRVDQPYAGVNITPAQAEVDVTDPTSIYLRTTADQQDVIYIDKGTPATIVFDAFPDTDVKGAVTFISYSPSKGEEHSYTLKIALPENIVHKLRLGMSADATVTTQEKHNVIAVPIEALKEENGKAYVITKKNGKEDKTFVTTGLTTADEVEILKGLSPGMVIVVTP